MDLTLPSVRHRQKAEERARYILASSELNPNLIEEYRRNAIQAGERLLKNINYNAVPTWMKQKIDMMSVSIAALSKSDEYWQALGDTKPSAETKAVQIALVEILHSEIFDYFLDPAGARAEQVGRSAGTLIFIGFIVSVAILGFFVLR